MADGRSAQRALVTSRLPLVDVSAWEGGAVTTVALGPLDDASAGALLARHGLRADSAAFAGALASMGGHALSLDVLGSLSRRWRDGDASQLPPLDLDAAVEDDPRARRLARLLRHYADRLTRFERDLLARVSAYARGASVDALAGLAAAPPSLAGALAGATRADIARRLARLADAGLVFAQRAGDRYSAHPFVRDVFRALGPERELQADRARVELLATLEFRPGAVALDPSARARYGELLEHTLGAGLVDDAAGVYLGAMGGFAHLGMVRGAFAEGLSAVSAFSPERHPAALVEGLSSSHRLALTYDWALYAVALGELRVAEAALQAHEAAARAANAQGRLLVVHRAHAYALRLAGRFDEAIAHARASVARARGFDSRRDEAVGHALEGMILHACGDLDGALSVQRASALGDRPSARRALWEASLRLERGEIDAAHALAQRARDEVAALGWRVHAAEADALLGAVALARRRRVHRV